MPHTRARLVWSTTDLFTSKLGKADEIEARSSSDGMKVGNRPASDVTLASFVSAIFGAGGDDGATTR